MHLPWMDQAKNQEYVAKFMDYALAKPDTWVSEPGRDRGEGKSGRKGSEANLCWGGVRVGRVWQRWAGRQLGRACSASPPLWCGQGWTGSQRQHVPTLHTFPVPPRLPRCCCCSL